MLALRLDWVKGAPAATTGGRVITGAREQLEAVGSNWSVVEVEETLPSIDVAEWMGRSGLEWEPGTGWVTRRHVSA